MSRLMARDATSRRPRSAHPECSEPPARVSCRPEHASGSPLASWRRRQRLAAQMRLHANSSMHWWSRAAAPILLLCSQRAIIRFCAVVAQMSGTTCSRPRLKCRTPTSVVSVPTLSKHVVSFEVNLWCELTCVRGCKRRNSAEAETPGRGESPVTSARCRSQSEKHASSPTCTWLRHCWRCGRAAWLC